jgi:hypothetical protein
MAMDDHSGPLELVAIVAWDDAEGRIPMAVEDYPSMAWITPEQTRRVRSPVRLRLDPSGGFHLLGESGDLVHLDAAGRAFGRTPLVGAGSSIVDYACDPGGDCLLLERLDQGGQLVNRLRRLDRTGRERWSRVGPRSRQLEPASFTGTFSKILWDGGANCYLPAEWHGSGVVELAADTGELGRTLHQRAGAGAPFLAGGRLVSAFLDPAANRRGIAVLDPGSGQSAEHLGGDEHFAWLVYPFGADALARLYVWREGRIARLSLEGDLEVLGALDGVAMRAGEGVVFSSHASGAGVVVTGGGAPLTLPLPPDFRLVHVDDEGRYHLVGGEEPGSAGEVRVYTRRGEPVASHSAADGQLWATEDRLPPHGHWQVSGQGDVLIPLVTPQGVAIVRLAARRA